MASHLKDAQEEAELNMTPMIDVVFLLIIFFLCIDFKTLEAKLPAYLPKDKGSQTTPAEPVEQLSVKIVCDNWGTEVPRKGNSLVDENGERVAFQLQNHQIHWEVNTRSFTELDKLKEHLTDIAEDPSRRVPDKDTGGTKLMPVVIEPDTGTTYGDVARTVDAILAAKFNEINFGGGRGRR